MIKNCPMRHENGNCIPAGGFCTANKNICEALLNAYRMGKAQLSQEGTTSDLIDRQAALDIFDDYNVSVENGELEAYSRDRKRMCELPPAQPEVLACGNGELVAQPEPTDIDAKEAVYNLAKKIGIHQLFALTVELRGEPIQPEPHEGRWINGKCDLCGEHAPFWCMASTYHESNFCPNCGAKMKGAKHESN